MTARAPIGCGIALVTLTFLPAASWAAQTIVGTWAPDPSSCTPVGGMVFIGPLSLTADETSCRFEDVSRSGNVVTWHGRCSDGEASRPSTVVARLQGGLLTFKIDGAPNGPFRRCAPQ